MLEREPMSERGILSYGAKGDGTDDAEAFQRAFKDPGLTTLIIEDTPSGKGYALDMGVRGLQFRVRAGVTVRGEGWGSRLVQTGDFIPKSLFVNADELNGDNAITFDGVNVEGKWDQYPKGTAWIGPQNPMMRVFTITSEYVRSGGSMSEGFRMVNCRIVNWPGAALFAFNLAHAEITGNTVDRISGGGLIFRFRNTDVEVKHNQITRVCDDAIAFNAKDKSANTPPKEYGIATNCRTSKNVLSRFNPDWAGGSATGPVYSIRGGNVRSVEDRILPSPGGGFKVVNLMLTDVTIESPRIEGTAKQPIFISKGCRGTARDIQITNCPAIVNQSPETFRIAHRRS